MHERCANQYSLVSFGGSRAYRTKMRFIHLYRRSYIFIFIHVRYVGFNADVTNIYYFKIVQGKAYMIYWPVLTNRPYIIAELSCYTHNYLHMCHYNVDMQIHCVLA